jgi:uncharacterized membrane protein required for colicin V production
MKTFWKRVPTVLAGAGLGFLIARIVGGLIDMNGAIVIGCLSLVPLSCVIGYAEGRIATIDEQSAWLDSLEKYIEKQVSSDFE